jgi:hypothetical protein
VGARWTHSECARDSKYHDLLSLPFVGGERDGCVADGRGAKFNQIGLICDWHGGKTYEFHMPPVGSSRSSVI